MDSEDIIRKALPILKNYATLKQGYWPVPEHTDASQLYEEAVKFINELPDPPDQSKTADDRQNSRE
ncbi:hypothetical protein LCGC14_0356270 [marine sediment metagenome]|uniref:Uncharacterized protein n=1 Tax=marine sediment metagenome TaxID=412755 RepID=A0A0F9T9K1_9ZZZZ